MHVLLIRHGQSVANAEGRFQGLFDSPLSELGRAQARAVADRLRRDGWTPAEVITSDLSRAAETARIIAGALGVPVVPEPQLREYDAGILNGTIWKEVELLYPELWRAIHASREWVPVPGEEGNDSFRERVAAAWAALLDRNPQAETLAIVAHGGSLGMLLAHLLGMDMRRPLPFRFDNASLSLVELAPRGTRLCCFNDTCHLRAPPA